MGDIEKKVDAAISLIKKHGKTKYLGDDDLTIESHLIQTAMYAYDDGQGPNVVLGSLFHDIGLLVGIEKKLEPVLINDTDVGPKDHDAVGEQFLKENGFPPEIYGFCKGNTQGLRYLVFKDPNFKKRMRQMSYHTLSRRGGPMKPDEAKEFEKNPLFHEFCMCRRWDENSRDPDATLEPLDKYRAMAISYLKSK